MGVEDKLKKFEDFISSPKGPDIYYHTTSRKSLEKIRSMGELRYPVHVSEVRATRFTGVGQEVLLELDLSNIDIEVDDDPKALYGWWKTTEDVPSSRIVSIKEIR